MPIPIAPSNVFASVISSTRIDVRWNDNSSDETSFRIERCSGSGCSSFSEIASVSAGVTSYSDTTSASTIYRYRVRARNASGDSAYATSSYQVTSLASGRSLTTVSLYPLTLRLRVGETRTIAVWAKNDQGTQIKQFYTAGASSDSGKATTRADTIYNPQTPYQEQTGRVITVVGVAAGTTNLTATLGSVTSDTCVVTVDDPAASPTATLSGDTTNGGTISAKIGEAIEVAGDSSVGVFRNVWTWGDGMDNCSDAPARQGFLLSATHAYLAAGTYNASLKVVNSAGSSSMATFTVIVTAITPTSTVNCSTAAQVLSAWNAATGGEEIVIPANTTIAALDLPIRTFSDWVTIRSNGTMPVITKRISPAADAAQLTTIQTTAVNSTALNLADGQAKVRFKGLKFDIDAAHQTYYLVQVGRTNQTLSSQNPQKIIFEHCVIDGGGEYNIVHGFTNNGYKVSVLSSDFQDIGVAGTESQAIFSHNARGAHYYYNTHVQATTENSMYGGTTTTIPYLVSTNIEFRNCYYDKKLAWKDSAYSWKNLFETKLGRRIYVYGSYFDLQYAQAQTYAIAIKTNAETDDSPWQTSQDVIFDSCRTGRMSGGTNNLWDRYNDSVSPKPANIAFNNCLWEDLNNVTYGNFGFLILTHQADDQSYNHNTLTQPTANIKGTIVVSDPNTGSLRFVVKNSILPFDAGGIGDSNSGYVGTAALDIGTLSLWTVSYNVFPNHLSLSTTGYPGTGSPMFNSYPATIAAVGFTDYANGNYQLTAGSAYHNAASDGTDPGVDFAALKTALGASSSNFTAATFNVITGDWPGNAPPPGDVTVSNVRLFMQVV